MVGKQVEAIHYSDVYAKPGDWFGADDFSGKRYEAVDPNYPEILIHAMPNPCNRAYRMVDRRRRMGKLRRAGVESGLFFVAEFEDYEEFIFDYLVEGIN